MIGQVLQLVDQGMRPSLAWHYGDISLVSVRTHAQNTEQVVLKQLVDFWTDNIDDQFIAYVIYEAKQLQ